MIYTSYFAMIRNFPNNMIPLSIAQFPPKWYTGACTKQFAPEPGWIMPLKQQSTPTSFSSYQGVSDNEYTRLYTNKIEKMMISDNTLCLFDILQNTCPVTTDGIPVWQSQTNHIALCCFEKPADFCHRHIFADILREHNILDIREITKEELLEIKNKEISTL